MNPKLDQSYASPDAGRKNLISQRSGSNSSVRKLLLLISIGEFYWWENKDNQRKITRTLILLYIGPRPSRQCTFVNNSKNSGSRRTLNNYITRCPDVSSQLETGCQRENQLADRGLWALSDPRLSNPSQDEEVVLLWSREELGSILQSVPVSNSSLTHNKHHPFKNKVWEIIFL